jgi:hypothetical protein
VIWRDTSFTKLTKPIKGITITLTTPPTHPETF